MGNMKCVSTPYTVAESIRVELIPGTGMPLIFKSGKDGKVGSVEFDRLEFVKK
jgi:hypothetical protein